METDLMEWAFLFIVLIGGIVLAVVVISQIFATARAKMSVAREEAYRKLAEENAEAQRRTADWLERAGADLADLRNRMTEMERMLKEVG